MKKILLLTITILTLHLQSYSQNYTIAQKVLGYNNNDIKTNYPNAKFEKVDDVPTYKLEYKDGKIIMIIAEGTVSEVLFLFFSDKAFADFIAVNSKYWRSLSRGKFYDPVKNIILTQGVDNMARTYLVAKFKINSI